jgi:hypothetical protein
LPAALSSGDRAATASNWEEVSSSFRKRMGVRQALVIA